MELLKNKTYRAQIVDYTADGSGVARIGGMAVFVPCTVVGDQCDILLTKVSKNVAFGRVQQVIVPSKHRIAPACPHAGQCGGCCFQHMSYEEELRAKEKKVRDALTRIGGIDGDKLTGIVGAPETERYRNKAQYPVGLSGEGRVVTGFYRPRSHDIVPVERCLIQPEIADRIAAYVRAWMQQNAVAPYDHQTGKGMVRHVYVRTGAVSGEAQLTLVVTTRKLPALDELVTALRLHEPALTGVLLNLNRRTDNVILGDRTVTLWGQPLLEDKLCGSSFLLSPHAFYQVNHAQATRLYERALELAALTGQETVIDLYCGAGTITLALAKKAKRVIGVELVPEAVENARENASRNGVTNAEFICADAGQAATMLAVRGEKPEVLTVDPPRKGLDDETIAAIVSMAPPRLVYVSCDPATLARDLKKLAAEYEVKTAAAYDLFPRSSHCEVCVELCRK